jgi:hypothetical protein
MGKFNFNRDWNSPTMEISKNRYESSQAYIQYETYEEFKGVEIKEGEQRHEKFRGEGKKNIVQLWVNNEK